MAEAARTHLIGPRMNVWPVPDELAKLVDVVARHLHRCNPAARITRRGTTLIGHVRSRLSDNGQPTRGHDVCGASILAQAIGEVSGEMKPTAIKPSCLDRLIPHTSSEPVCESFRYVRPSP